MKRDFMKGARIAPDRGYSGPSVLRAIIVEFLAATKQLDSNVPLIKVRHDGSLCHLHKKYDGICF